MSFPIKKLGDVFTIARGGSPRPIQNFITDDPDGINWIMIGDTKEGGKYIESTAKKIKKEGMKKSREVFPGDFLLTNSMSFGRPYILKTQGCIHDGWLVLSPKSDQINTDYFYYYLGSNDAKKVFTEKAAGAVVKNLNSEIVREIEIPLPPLPEQQRIAAILDKADAIRRKRQQAIQLADEFLRSVFLEMFGDPVTNPKSFSVEKLKNFYINEKHGTKCGPFGSALKKHEFQPIGVPVWNMDNINLRGNFIDKPSLWVGFDKYLELENYSVEQGDVIISRAGTVGKMGVVQSKYKNSLISTNLIRVRFGKNLLSNYFVSLMTYCKGRVGRLETGPDGSFTHMSTKILDDLEFPYPPIELQREFARRVQKVEGLKAKLKASQAQAEAQFNALSQRAFAGEL